MRPVEPRNKGWELSVGLKPLNRKDYGISLSFNTSKVYNKVTNADKEQNTSYTNYVNGSVITNGKPRDDHIRYFLKYILPVIPRSRGQVVEKDEFKCVHYVRLPLFAQGNLMEWISKNVVYPKDAIQNNWEGKIVIGFTVELDGSLSNVHVIKGGAYSLNVEAVRLMKSAPKFIPAWCPLHQQNVRRDLTVTISFNLQ